MTTTAEIPIATRQQQHRSIVSRYLPALVAWAAGAAVYLLATAYHYRVLNVAPRAGHLFFEDWLIWDTGHYLDIASHGYDTFERHAFFPAYPLLLRATDALPGGQRVAGPIVTMLIALAALLMIQRLAEHEFERPVAVRTVFYLVAFPSALFLYAPYNEGLFVLFGAIALYSARKELWIVAGLAAALAGTVRAFGVLLVIPLAYEYFRVYRRPRPSLLFLGLAPAGLVAYAIYCRVTTGDWLAFVHAQDHWHRGYTWPLLPQVHAAQLLDQNPVLSSRNLLYTQQLVLFALAVVCLILMIVGPWRFRRDQRYLTVYSAVLLLPLFVTEVGQDDPLGSLPRFLLELIPMFLLLGRVGARDLVDRVLLMGFVSLNVINMLTFLNKNTFVS
jgi:Gpi18-like mannosyltransferase